MAQSNIELLQIALGVAVVGVVLLGLGFIRKSRQLKIAGLVVLFGSCLFLVPGLVAL
jgi:type IV secretory pathway VirB2 component (pilin)